MKEVLTLTSFTSEHASSCVSDPIFNSLSRISPPFCFYVDGLMQWLKSDTIRCGNKLILFLLWFLERAHRLQRVLVSNYKYVHLPSILST